MGFVNEVAYERNVRSGNVESCKGAETRLSVIKVVITAVLTLWNTKVLKTIVVLIGKRTVSITGTSQVTFWGNFFLTVKRNSTLFCLSRIMLNWKCSSQKELNDLYCSPNIIRVIKWRMRWVDFVACMGDKKCTQGCGRGNVKEIDHL
jgi:hypothetical protein